MIALEDIKTRLEAEDEATVLTLLGLSSEDLVRTFKGRIRARAKQLREYYEYDQEEPEETSQEERTNRSNGSPSLWEETTITNEYEDY